MEKVIVTVVRFSENHPDGLELSYTFDNIEEARRFLQGMLSIKKKSN